MHAPNRPVPVLPLVLIAALALAGCGGGGSATTNEAPEGPPPPEIVDTVTVVPATVEANFSTEVRIEGGRFAPPVICQLVDDAGTPVGPPCSGRVIEGGQVVGLRSPMLPQLDASADLWLEVRDGAGRRARSDRRIRIAVHVADTRAIDGSGNNETNPTWGAAGSPLRLDVSQAFDDGVSSPAGQDRPSARAVSNIVCAQNADVVNAVGASDLFWVFGQFLDHDIDLTTEGDEAFEIEVPLGDPVFDPFFTGIATIGMNRSEPLAGTGTSIENPRRHPNRITSWIDASNVYGSDAERGSALRALDGTGRLLTSGDGRLPMNTAGLPNAPTGLDPTLFLAGDVRANENVALTSLHTLFVREHNRVADRIRADNPHLSGDEVLEAARAWVAAEIQVITIREFLPILLGPAPLSPYRGYDPSVDGSIGVLFSTAAYRFGHSMVSGTIYRLDGEGDEIDDGHLSLVEAFFNPGVIAEGRDIDPILRGIAAREAQAIDPLIVDELRNLLFGAPGSPGLDLAALNLQRGRDHGLPDYGTCCVELGLTPRATMADVSSSPDTVALLETAYGDVADMDVWVVALCEDPLPGALVGELLHSVFVDQFERLRDGDRFWYERVYAGEALEALERTRLADVIRRNTGIGQELSDNPFIVGAGAPPRPPALPLTEPTPSLPRDDLARVLTNRFTR